MKAMNFWEDKINEAHYHIKNNQEKTDIVRERISNMIWNNFSNGKPEFEMPRLAYPQVKNPCDYCKLENSNEDYTDLCDYCYAVLNENIPEASHDLGKKRKKLDKKF